MTDQRRQLPADFSFIPKVVEATLRDETSSPAQAHHVARAAEFHGRAVPQELPVRVR